MMHKPSNRFIVPKIFENIPHLVAGVSTRHGGVSQAPYQSLNLGKHTADLPEAVEQNVHLLCNDLQILPQQLARAYQCHDNAIWETTEGGYKENFDAIIATEKGVIAGVGIADCCPILIVDPIKRLTAAIHAGWKGTVADITNKTATALINKYGSKVEDLKAWIGPCISFKHFQVGEEVAKHFHEEEKIQDKEKYLVDLKKANERQLLEAGLTQIEISTYCTIEDNALFFSHRLEKGTTGRMMAFAGFRK